MGKTLGLLALGCGIFLLTWPLYLPPIYPVVKVIETDTLWQNENIHVPAETELTAVSFYLERGDSVKMAIVVNEAGSGLPFHTPELDIGYSVKGPRGKIIGEEKKLCDTLTSCNFPIESKEEGMYIVRLDNTFSKVSYKDVSVAWKIKSKTTTVEISSVESSVRDIIGGGLLVAGGTGVSGVLGRRRGG